MTPCPPRLILLAPMEGVLDHSLRDVLTRVGGVDRCVSEFIRVTDRLLPARVFLRLMPELRHGSRTPAGVPVRAQLLGSDPAVLADNAARLAELGAEGVDLNFGCPAKTVNRHRGGAVLLDEPALVHDIVAAVRRAVPAGVPVSAKMRLGHRDEERLLDNARGIAAAGAGELVVHARTKLHGYRPPAYWDRIDRVREALAGGGTRVVANGEVWTVDDARRCLVESGCDALMLGRGLVADPGLALAVRGLPAPGWAQIGPLLPLYAERVRPRVAPRHRGGRLKQWINQLRRRHPQAQALYEAVRTLHDADALEQVVRAMTAPGAPDMEKARGPVQHAGFV
ncbi:MAG: tRNA-dihydrouridine synthase [Burkholderiaceae bacterium]|jgi:tRNA-dihydrouridine synthase C|nr:tRNA-dihydrouridine synthase [Burkholderiaceae bacterium]